jgi:hypothetical protein
MINIYFSTKNYLKNNHYQTNKHSLNGAGLAEWLNRQLIDYFICLFIKGLTCQ